MNFVGIRELSNNTKSVMSMLADNRVVVTEHGKPVALLIGINESNFENILNSLETMEAMSALRSLQKQAQERFPDGMSEEEIEAEIDAARKEM